MLALFCLHVVCIDLDKLPWLSPWMQLFAMMHDEHFQRT